MKYKIYTAKDKNHLLAKALLAKGTDNFEYFWSEWKWSQCKQHERGWILNGVWIGWNITQALEKINNLLDLRKDNKVRTKDEN